MPENPKETPPMVAIDEFMLDPFQAAAAEDAPALTPAEMGEPDDAPSATHGEYHERDPRLLAEVQREVREQKEGG